jgi:hypothetical protein
MEPCLIILNCIKYADKRAKQLSTWLASPDFPIKRWYHVIGNPRLPTEFQFDTDQHILYVNCADNYISLPQKTYLAVKAVCKEYPSVNYILKTDDDMNCNISALIKCMDTIYKAEYDYGGRLLAVNDHMSVYHYASVEPKDRTPRLCRGTVYASGRFYFLSRRAAEFILKQRKVFWDSIFEDNAIGYTATKLPGVKPFMIEDKSVFYEFS